MRKLLPILFLITAGCGYDGSYRYKCQDPANWKSEECNPPLCVAAGECTKDILGYDPSEEQP